MSRANRLAQVFVLAAVGGVGFFGCNKEGSTSNTADNRTPGEKVADGTKQLGDSLGHATNAATQGVTNAANATTQGAKNLATQASAHLSPTGATGPDGVRNVFEGIVTNALDKNNYNDLIGYFTKADQDRLSNSKPDTKDLDAAVDQFKKSWHDKYNDNFKVMDNDKVYTGDFFALGGGNAAAGAPTTATVAASHGLPDLSLPLVVEGGLYKLDVPDTLDGTQLHDNLLNAIKDLNKDPSTWPQDKADAYRLVSHRILMAVEGKSL